MRYFKLCFLILIALPIFIRAECVLRERIHAAQEGEFFVTAQGRFFTFFLVESFENNQLVIQEVTAPLNCYKNVRGRYMDWLTQGAIGHLTWLRYTIDMNKGEMTQVYSFKHNGWLSTEQAGQILSQMLNLSFSEKSPYSGRYMGDAALSFQPPCIYEGRIVKDVMLKPYFATWPKDGSELSGKSMTVYFLEGSTKYPSCLPYWIEVKGMVGKAHLRVIDSGKGLVLPNVTIKPIS